MKFKLPLLIVGALLVLIGAVMATGASPLGTLNTLYQGSLGNAANISGTLRETTPLLIAGIAVFIGLRAGLFNIGVEGQLLMGAMTCAVVALKFPGIPGIILGTLCGMIAGALWALPAGLIKAYRNGHEVITTIMLNNVAVHVTSALVAGPIRDPATSNTSTASITKATHLPNLISGPLTINSSLVIGVIVSVATWLWMKRTVAGYELQATGANVTAARFAGIHTKKVTLMAMLASGAIGGMAGAFQVLAYEGRFYASFSPGYGFDALGVALLSGASAIALIPASLLFGILAKGGTVLQIEGIPKGITGVILGVLIIIAAAVRYRKVKGHA